MREWGPSYFRSLDRENRLYGLRQHWSSNVRERVELLRELQAEHGELQAKFKEEVAALEAKLYQPLFTKRYEIVNGISEFESDEAASVEEKGVPGFWLAALKNNRDLFKVITRRDGECLKFLKDIKWSLIYDQKGFKLEFFFAPNPYFKNSVLTKMYLMIDEDEPKETIGTEIDWYPGKLLTQKVLKKKKKKKKAKSEKNPIAETKPCRSFFHFFNPIQVPGEETDEDEFDVDDFNMADFYDAIEYLDYDYKIGSIIGEKIIPNAVSWFTREVDEAFCDDLEIDYEEEDDDEDEDEMERQRKSHMLLGRKMDWKKKKLSRFENCYPK